MTSKRRVEFRSSVLTSRGVCRRVGSDALLFTMKGIPLSSRSSRVGKKYQIWNINKEGGWHQFKELIENNDNLNTIAKIENENPTEVMKQIDNELKNVKFKSFGKNTVRNELKITK